VPSFQLHTSPGPEGSGGQVPRSHVEVRDAATLDETALTHCAIKSRLCSPTAARAGNNPESTVPLDRGQGGLPARRRARTREPRPWGGNLAARSEERTEP
jgi:hypothetical protein